MSPGLGSMTIRMGGRFSAAEAIEELDQSQGRLILCSRDFARGSLVLGETSDEAKTPFFAAFPAGNCLDGNRNSFMQAAVKTAWVRLTIDTGTAERKSLLFIEYPEDEFIEPSEVELTNDRGGEWHSVMADTALLYEGRRYGLWSLPFAKGIGTSMVATVSSMTSPVRIHPVEKQLAPGIGWRVLVQTGVCTGMGRVLTGLVDMGNDLNDFIIDRPFPSLPAVGTQVLMQGVPGSYLSGRFVRVKLRRKYHVDPVTVPASQPFRITGVSLFDCYAELKGDKGNFRRVRPPNPSGLEREVHTGVQHATLGGLRVEQWGGPKEKLSLSWEVMCLGGRDLIRDWSMLGVVGLVDETHRYMQGVIESPFGYSALPIDNAGRMEISLRAVMMET